MAKKTLNDCVSIYQAQLRKGDILIAYNGVVKFVMSLRVAFMKKYSDRYSFSGILHGYMDYTYFYYSNPFLKSRKLKLGLVLNHLEMRFEIWLLGNTGTVQKAYWSRLKDTKWNKDKQEMPEYSIIEAVIAEDPDFDNLPLLMQYIEKRLIEVSEEIINTLRAK